ncbi:putative surface-anchored fimbrial subunit [Corynebacterium kutscheri]|uniref:Surface-anchored fimbrial subunit n=2 Tax=Corynebacterium kutscheri TaxID=35755 RepID=A0AB38VPY5_9CORY|nr:putative surface-anchored fimbrial subunit [Corynebacterium kutscheri]
MYIKTSIGRRVVCSVGVAALLTSVAAIPATAQEPVPVADSIVAPAASNNGFGNIDSKRKGSITIHKHEHQQGEQIKPGNPETGEYQGDPKEGISGVEFTYYKLGLDLKKDNKDWDKLGKFTGSVPQDACTAEGLEKLKKDFPNLESPGKKATTGDNGQAKIDGLDLDGYLICETNAPANVIDRAAPFIVTLPYPYTSDGQGDKDKTTKWIYDVHVFPKNAKTRLNKTVESQDKHGLGIGSEVRFPVTAEVPRIAEGRTFKHFYLVDPMDPRFKKDSLKVPSVMLGDTALVEKQDYIVTVKDHMVTVSFTRKGLEKLEKNPGKKVVAIFSGVLEKLDAEKREYGRIQNRAYIYTDTQPKPDGEVPPTDPPTTPPTIPPTDPPNEDDIPPNVTPEVKTFWGNLVIKKIDAADKKTGLKGAKFKVYAAKTPYPDNKGQCSKEYDPKDVVKKAGKTGEDLEVTTDDQGRAEFQGLFVSDDQNDPKSKDFRCYVLVETAAPAGFVTPQGENAAHAVAVEIGKTPDNEYGATISNVKRDVPEIPLTGGRGVTLMLLAGGILMIIAIGAGVVVVRRARD